MNASVRVTDVTPVRRELALADGAISFLEWKGEGPQPVLHFAHANGFNAMTYRHLLSPLASRFHIRAWDARGHGLTSLPADPSSHANWYVYRDDLIRFLEPFVAETGGPVLLGGHSMGGATSLMVAAERPDLVRGLILVDPVMVPRSARLIMRLYNLTGRKGGPNSLADGAERRRNVFADRATMAAAYKGRGAFRTWPEEMIADYVEGGTKPRADGQIELACAPAWEAANFRAQGHDIWKALDRLKVPLTLIYAGIGSTCRAPAPQLLGERDPQATLLRLGQATHFLPMEYPDIVRRETLALDARLS
ncbi:MAG TPA: alpha/beta hydrolase [Parvibaculum sp.]|jgi:pimeloyl-ACP methyl ester carboxylesterase